MFLNGSKKLNALIINRFNFSIPENRLNIDGCYFVMSGFRRCLCSTIMYNPNNPGCNEIYLNLHIGYANH